MPKEKVSILILLDLIQDLDIVTPLFKKSLTRDDLSIQVCVTDWLAKQSPRVEQTLKNLNINYFIVKQKLVMEGSKPSLNGFEVLVTASETTAVPHKSAHILTQRFNETGLKTYTLQHGFENIGLTYFDEIHTPDSINFASQKILIWGNLDSLSPKALPEIRERCIPVGCPKEIPPKPPQINIPGNREYLIGIFENLHWHRYDDRYRNLFLEHLEKVALTFPNTTFLVKPHHAGQWLTKIYQGQIPTVENLVIADPKKIEWEAYTAPVLINYADGIITTPSTVALDAAMANCPVSIVSCGLNLQRYNPLTLLNTLEDWLEFTQKIQQEETRAFIQDFGSQFIHKNILLEDAATKIFNLIVKDIVETRNQMIFPKTNVYPPLQEIKFLESIPFDYKFRGINQKDFLNRLTIERNLFIADTIPSNLKKKVISLIVLVNKKPTIALEKTIKLWALQSCPCIDCILVPLEDVTQKCLNNWIVTHNYPLKIRVWSDPIIEWQQLKDQSDFIVFTRPGNLLSPSLATQIKLIELSDQPDILVWNVQQSISDYENLSDNQYQFLRKPDLEIHTLRHHNYIGTDFAVKPSLAAAYPYDIFEHIIYNSAHLFHIWLSDQPELKWYTYPEFFSLRTFSNRSAKASKLFQPFTAIYKELFHQITEEFSLEIREDENLPYLLKPQHQAESISVVICFRDRADLTCRCLNSIFQQKLSANLEIILVNNQSNANTLEELNTYLQNYHQQYNIKIIDYNFPFNHSRQCNLGVEASNGEVIVFLNNDAEIVAESALADMAAWALVDGIATVGCRITSHNHQYLCAGIKARESCSPKNYNFICESKDWQYAFIVREAYGNTFACAAISRKNYHLMGSLNEIQFPIGFNDVEFLLRSRQAGFTNIYLGYLEILHNPGTSRGRSDESVQSIKLRCDFPETSIAGILHLEQDDYLTNQSLHSKSIKKLRMEIEAMKSSKFWKLREKWFTFKNFLGISTD
ncbi:MAG: glycosyltransferase [Xenococcaceae cyanobacterium MO_167.B52]|nr:glycosyltransferase [Xenococcaceae cyanobacterium MO_167.B52]